MKVLTIKGLVDLSELRVKDVVEIGDNHRKIFSQYWLGDELVRQSVFVDVLRPLEAGVTEGQING